MLVKHFIGLFLIVLLSACSTSTVILTTRAAAEDKIVTQKLPQINDFDKIALTSPATITINDGAADETIELTGPKSLLSAVIVDVANHTLEISMPKTYKNMSADFLKICIELPHLSQLKIANGANVTVNKLNIASLQVETVLGGNLTINGQPNLELLNSKNSGAININGLTTSNLAVNILGNNRVVLRGTQVGLTKLKHIGNGDMTISGIVNTPFDATLIGAGQNYLYGKAINLQNLLYSSPANFSVNNVSSDNLLLNADGGGNITLLGRVNVQHILHKGHGRIFISQAFSDGLSIRGYGNSVVTLLGGDINLLNLEVSNTEKVFMSHINSAEVAISIGNQTEVHLQGDAAFMNAEALNTSILDAYSLETKRIYIKTKDRAQAHVRPVNMFNAYARDGSDIYYYQQPKFIAPLLYTAGSVLPLFSKAPPYPIAWDRAAEYWMQN